jgi:hypothetical protein
MMSVGFGVTRDLDAVPTAARDVTTWTDDLYLHERWLRVEEDAHPGDHFYAWAADGVGSAFAAAYRFDASSNPWPAARLDLFLAEYAQVPPGTDLAEMLPSYLLGGRRPGHSHILTKAPYGNRRELLTRLIGGAAEMAAGTGAAGIAALYCDHDDEELAAAFRTHGGVRLPSPGGNTIPLPGTSPEDHLARLASKRRSDERLTQAKLAEAGVTYEIRPLTEPDIDEIVPLELGLYDKYGHDYRPDEARALHVAYLNHLGDDALVLRVSRDGALIGFCSIVRHGPTAYMRQGGFDPELCQGLPVYLGAVFQAPLPWAYDVGVRMLDLSISADETKRYRGAISHPHDAWVIPLTDRAATVLSSIGREVA